MFTATSAAQGRVPASVASVPASTARTITGSFFHADSKLATIHPLRVQCGTGSVPPDKSIAHATHREQDAPPSAALDLGPAVPERDRPIEHQRAWPGIDHVTDEIRRALELIAGPRRITADARLDLRRHHRQRLGVHELENVPIL